jgi:CRP-like cAMP-binding protein|mmetsp:Transcript_20031/g.3281  ORF Transcript_20031/g.3281 Transcript_20031/m.3281 type:complete len:104 (+) Transcript_20031:377-688(+)
MNQSLIKHIYFLQDKPSYILALIVPCLSPLYIEVNDYIYKIGDPNDSFYFLVKGKVKINMQLKSGKIVHLLNITEGHYFGDIDMLFEQTRTESAKTDNNCELL